ncbi:MAG: glycosyltransferase family 9 protein [Deltaproteobacteria bacterium]|nr:glycosyltransferase family 9 protein [Deltaproteobacteria bacterium]
MEIESVIFIRRDNIGDLVCTTPAIRAVRRAFPRAKIGVLVNSYNAPVLRGNTDIDRLYVYQKPKHLPGKSRLAVLWGNFKVFQEIRREGYDAAIAGGSYSKTLARFTFLTGAKKRVGYGKKDLYLNMAVDEGVAGHEAIKTFRLLEPFGITGEPGGLVLAIDEAERKRYEALIRPARKAKRPVVAVAISARIKRNRWPLEKFIGLIEGITGNGAADVLLVWAPGSKDNPMFSGDEESARTIKDRFGDRIMAFDTPSISSLIAALSCSDIVVTLDTGSLHISAALGKATVALMTKPKALCWYPWKTKSRVITADPDVKDIAVEDVFGAVKDFIDEHGKGRD